MPPAPSAYTYLRPTSSSSTHPAGSPHSALRIHAAQALGTTQGYRPAAALSHHPGDAPTRPPLRAPWTGCLLPLAPGTSPRHPLLNHPPFLGASSFLPAAAAAACCLAFCAALNFCAHQRHAGAAPHQNGTGARAATCGCSWAGRSGWWHTPTDASRHAWHNCWAIYAKHWHALEAGGVDRPHRQHPHPCTVRARP
jgi:hypothetical protein